MFNRIPDVLLSQRLQIVFRILEVFAGVHEACKLSETTRNDFGEQMISAAVMTVRGLMGDPQFSRNVTQTEVLYTFFSNDFVRSLHARLFEVSVGGRFLLHPVLLS